MHSMEVAFDVRPGADVIAVKATPAWITGMAYAVTGALSHRCTSIIAPCLDAAGLTRPAEAAATLLRQTRTSARLPPPPLPVDVSGLHRLCPRGTGILIASSSFLKGIVRGPADAEYMGTQRLRDTLRVAVRLPRTT